VNLYFEYILSVTSIVSGIDNTSGVNVNAIFTYP
jgi:hypothetical protein